MIFLIAGPPRSGKTTLAKKLAGRFRCPSISADWLRSVILPYLEEGSHDRQVLESILFNSGKHGGQQTDIEEATVLWPGLRSFILDKARWTGDWVIDGIQLTPENLREVLDLDPGNRICAIILVKTDADKILAGFAQVKQVKNDWLLHRHGDDLEHLGQVANHIASQGNYFQTKGLEHGIEVVNTNDDFIAKINAAAEKIANIRRAARAAIR